MKIVSESLTMIAAGFGLVAALAWNEAIKQLIEQFVPKGKGVLSLFVYAVTVTVIAALVASRLLKFRQRFGDEQKS